MLTEDGLYRLMTWLSPSFPVGAFTYSHGLEYAVEIGLVSDRASLEAWVAAVVRDGSGRVDADFVREVHQAVLSDDEARFDRAVLWAEAQRGTAEMALESRNQGRAFLKTVQQSWPDPAFDRWAARLGKEPAYCVVVALAAAVQDVPLTSTMTAYLHAVSANLVSAAVRLVPLGQTDGQRVQAALAPIIAEAGEAALARDFDDLGQSAPLVDWASLCHETQYTRLFRS